MINETSDKNNIYTEEHILLGYKNSKNAKQLITYKFEGNSYTIIFNGQLYNSKDLIKELSNVGFSFEGNSDTEVLLKGYIHFGKDVLNKLNGAFGFAIWNKNKQELFFARDHFGVKPFYYSISENNFIFASEIKSILKFPRS